MESKITPLGLKLAEGLEIPKVNYNIILHILQSCRGNIVIFSLIFVIMRIHDRKVSVGEDDFSISITYIIN
jgi:hypothetical protein